MNEEYFELLYLVALWFITLLVAATLTQALLHQGWTQLRRRPVLAVICMLCVLTAGPIVGIIGLSTGVSISRWLGVSDGIAVLPLAFAIVGVVVISIQFAFYTYQRFLPKRLRQTSGDDCSGASCASNAAEEREVGDVTIMKRIDISSKHYWEVDTEFYAYISPALPQPAGVAGLYAEYEKLFTQHFDYEPIDRKRFNCSKLSRSEFIENYLQAVRLKRAVALDILSEIELWVIGGVQDASYYATYRILSKDDRSCVRGGFDVGGPSDFSECMFIVASGCCITLFFEWND